MTKTPSTLAPLFAAALLALGAAAAHAQSRPVYRCGNGVYQHTPCEGGTVVASQQQTAAQRAEARRVAALEREAERKKKAESAAKAASGAAPAGAASAPAKKTP